MLENSREVKKICSMNYILVSMIIYIFLSTKYFLHLTIVCYYN